MKILYIITKSGYGGAQTHVRQLSNKMVQDGHEVAIISQPGDWGDIKFYPNPYLRNSFNPFVGMKAMKEIGKVVEGFQPDLVSLHSSAAGFWGRLAIKNKVPTIFTAHGWAFTEGVSLLRKKGAIIAEKMVAKYCDKIICVSEYDRQLALKYGVAGENKLVTAHNGVELSSANSKLETRNSKQYPINKKQNLNPLANIIFVGRLGKQKDPESFIKGFAEVAEPIKELAQVDIIGGGPKREKLEKMIKENGLEGRVNLLGALPREQVFEKLAKADIFALISHYEGFPRSILEAMSMGLPIIASNVGGVSEAVYPETGFLIEPVRKLQGNEEQAISQIQNALTELITNENTRLRMGEASRKRVEQEFSLEKMLQKTEEIYQSLTKV